MKKIDILGEKIGKIYVRECIGGNPIKYRCVCPCGEEFIATSQMIRKQNTDCGCGIVTGIRKKQFEVGDIYKGSKILDVQKKYNGQTYYIFECAICGEKSKRVHSVFVKNPICPKCKKNMRDEYKNEFITKNFIGKEINGIKILRISGRNEKSVLYVDAICPVCGKEFNTSLIRIKSGIKSCVECARKNLKDGFDIIKDAQIDGTSILNIKPDRALNKNNTTGCKGVSQYKNGKYRAYIVFRRKQYHLGSYDTLEQASKARRIAEEKIFGNFLEWYAEEFPEQWKRINKNENKRI